MILVKVLEIIFFKQRKWLEKFIGFKTQKNVSISESKNDFNKLLRKPILWAENGKCTEKISIYI